MGATLALPLQGRGLGRSPAKGRLMRKEDDGFKREDDGFKREDDGFKRDSDDGSLI